MKFRRHLGVATVLSILSAYAWGATAIWTGQMRFVTTVTYQQGVSCEYQYSGNKFWRTFVGSSCPTTVEVQ